MKAQQRFFIGFMMGANLSQLDGDNHQGYKKLGLQAGAKIIGRVTENIHLSTEILYTQLGSQFREGRGFQRPLEVIQLDYMTIPLIITKHFHRTRITKDHVYHRFNVSAGFAYSRLIHADINENELDPIDYSAASFFFNNNDFSVQFGGGFFINKHLGMEGRASVSFNRIFDNAQHPEINTGIVLLRNYYLMARIIYIL
ncbi:MAG: outer membrane beta-barrel protein [Bacteroidota bacterium]